MISLHIFNHVTNDDYLIIVFYLASTNFTGSSFADPGTKKYCIPGYLLRFEEINNEFLLVLIT